jgi:hypothetical protein
MLKFKKINKLGIGNFKILKSASLMLEYQALQSTISLRCSKISIKDLLGRQVHKWKNPKKFTLIFKTLATWSQITLKNPTRLFIAKTM